MRKGLAAGIRRGFLGSIVLAAACNPGPRLALPHVEFSGCLSVYRSPGNTVTCAPKIGAKVPLGLWVEAGPEDEVEIRLDSRRVADRGGDVQGGRSFALPFPAHGSALEVRVSTSGGKGTGIWNLTLAAPETVRHWAELKKAGKKGQARAYLEARLSGASPADTGFLLADLAWQARRDSEKDSAVAYFQKAITAHRRVHRDSAEIQVAAYMARSYVEDAHFPEARSVLTEVEPLLVGAGAESSYLVAFTRALLADRTGDYRTELEQVAFAVSLAERTGMSNKLWDARLKTALIDQDLGRSQEAKALFHQLAADPLAENPCNRASLLTNRAWSLLMAREAGETTEDPNPALRDALELYKTNLDCPQANQRGEQVLNSYLNLVLAAVQEERWEEARGELAEEQKRELEIERSSSRKLELSVPLRLWKLDLEGRLAIADGHTERALALYARLFEEAASAQSPEGRFRAFLGSARAWIEAGQREKAIASLAEADKVVDEQANSIPIQEGRDSFLAQRAAAARLEVDLLLEAKRPPSAFLFIRQARSRLLRELMAQQRLASLTAKERTKWEEGVAHYLAVQADIEKMTKKQSMVAADREDAYRQNLEQQLARARRELDGILSGLPALPDPTGANLAPPGPGEVVLAFHPLPHGWAGFATDAEGLEVSTFDLPPLHANPALAATLLGPFSARIRRAKRVRVLPYRELWAIDFHTLPFEGEPLIARHDVAYSLDLPVRAAPETPKGRRATVISDPLGNLPAARREGEAVAEIVSRWWPGWKPWPLRDREATATAVRKAFEESDHVHYAGHGKFGGRGGWESTLPLADQSDLTVGEILTLKRAPATVVLSACDSGHTSEATPGEGIGIAQALLVAGTRAVIASTRRIDDRAAGRFVAQLYRYLRPGSDPAHALRQAQLELSGQQAPDDWASFRLLVP